MGSASTNSSAVACLSAGLDSSVAMAMAIDRGVKISLALTFDYGQRALLREMEKAAQQARHFNIPHRTISLSWFKDLHRGGSLIDSSKELPSPREADLDRMDVAQKTAEAVWVPNRNGVMLEIAACLAEDLGCDSIIVGFNREEAATFPDNSTDYLKAISNALSFSTANHVLVTSPTAPLNKIEIVREAKRLDFDFSRLWSCYRADEKMCGACESCRRLQRALKKNEVPIDALFSSTDLA